MKKLLLACAAGACMLAVPVAGMAAEEVLRAETVIEAQTPTEGSPESLKDEFADQEKHNLTRIVRETEYKGIPVVVLDQTETEDGFGHISVDKATELGREILRLCPSGSRCTLNAIITNGTLTRIYSIQKLQ
jgi:Phosphotransferase system cellobiose-specific component IIB